MSRNFWMIGVLAMTGCIVGEDSEGSTELESQTEIKNNHPFSNPLGTSTTYSTNGAVNLEDDFFQDFGTNLRQCGHCHKPAEGWTVSAASVRQVFDKTGGLDPIFRTNDGSNSPNADVSTVEARRAAYSMLLTRGTIRVGMTVPAGAEFSLTNIEDPYGYSNPNDISLFRRPLPSANLKFIPQVMWDGRVTAGGFPVVTDALAEQSNGATLGHAAAAQPISPETRANIVAFETALFNAQQVAHDVGELSAEGAKGGAQALASMERVGGPGTRWNLFDAWKHSTNDARRAVWRGQELFNTRGRVVNGNLNPNLNCKTCHNVVNVGTNFAGTFFTINTSDADLRQADQPLYTFHNPTLNATIQTTDPGRALVTGRWIDMNKFKVPSIRALGSRAPYFHDGSASSLAAVVEHYEAKLGFTFTDAEAADMVAFLNAL